MKRMRLKISRISFKNNFLEFLGNSEQGIIHYIFFQKTYSHFKQLLMSRNSIL
jgi:hypothetical protein